MSKDRIGIIGLGWLGQQLAKELTATGYNCWGTKRTCPADVETTCIPLDIRGELPMLPPSEVIVITIPPTKMGEDQSEAERNLSQLIKSINNSVRQIIYISSTSVYPEINGDVREEDAVHQVSRHSGMDVLALEEVLSTSEHQHVIIRLGGLFGADRKPGSFIKDKITNGQQVVNMTHQTDAIRAIITLIEQGTSRGVFNICSPQHPTRAEFYSYACKKLGRMGELEVEYGEGSGKIVSAQLFIDTFNFQFQYENPILAL